MADVLSKKKRSQVMAAIRSTGNRATELRLAAIFRAHGIPGWRRHQPLPGTPDFVFRRERLAVFVDEYLGMDSELTHLEKYNIFVAHEDSYSSTIKA